MFKPVAIATQNIAFICRDEYEWIECQKELMKKGFRWAFHVDKIFVPDSLKDNWRTSVIYINDRQDNMLDWDHVEDVYCKTYPAEILFRNEKLKYILND